MRTAKTDDKNNLILYQLIASVFSYYKTGDILLFIYRIVIILEIAFKEGNNIRNLTMAYKWQTSGEHSGSPPFAIG